MMGTSRWRAICILPAVIVTLWSIPALGGAEVAQHSGTVLAIDREASTLVLGEVGPWRVKGGLTEITVRRIAFGPTTEVSVAARSADVGPRGWAGDFAERPSGEAALREGQFVTATVKRTGPRLTAEKILLVVPEP